MVWQGCAVLAQVFTALPPPFTTIPYPSSSLSTRLSPLSKTPSSWEWADFKCLSPSVTEVAAHGVSSVTTQSGSCQGQNEFVGGRNVEGERESREGIYYGKWWITRRCTDTPQKWWKEARRDGRKEKKSGKEGSSLAVASSGLRIAAVKGAKFYLFNVGLLKETGEGQVMCLLPSFVVWAGSIYEICLLTMLPM